MTWALSYTVCLMNYSGVENAPSSLKGLSDVELFKEMHSVYLNLNKGEM